MTVVGKSVAGQWRELERGLPAGWQRADLRLELGDPGATERTAALLGPAQPFRLAPGMLRFSTARDGSAPGPDSIVRLLARLDESGIGGDLTVAGSASAGTQAEREAASLADSWDAALAGLPSDWSDLLCELELASTDYIERASVLCIQLNPRRDGERAALRFRCARSAGYGVAPGMARRCLERCDGEGIHGSVRVLRVLSDTQLVATQGPVWLMAGKTV
ncbi:MAG: hypothetical protein ACRDM1_13135 [Gaiellaceae bacterium]